MNGNFLRRGLLRRFYPMIMALGRLTGAKHTVLHRPAGAPAPALPADLPLHLNNGRAFSLSDVKGRPLLLVNTASDCGYTQQYAALQRLQESTPGLSIILFPSNDFGRQERGSDEEIAAFCRVSFGLKMPQAVKASVRKGPGQHPVYRWLSDPVQNGWNDRAPEWNFSKYLLGPDGTLLHYFGPAVDPEGAEMQKALQPLLK